jgi:hypothetical protein
VAQLRPDHQKTPAKPEAPHVCGRLVRPGSVSHQSCRDQSGHERSGRAGRNRRSPAIHDHDLGRRSSMGPGSSFIPGCRAPSGLARENEGAQDVSRPAHTVVRHGSGYEATRGRAGAAKHPSRPDSHGSERTPNPQVGPAACWSLGAPNPAYNDQVITVSCRVPAGARRRRQWAPAIRLRLRIAVGRRSRTGRWLARSVGRVSRPRPDTGRSWGPAAGARRGSRP